jgi:ubiquinone/menaquinone biosynthesis C-methylase UbiE
LSRSCSLSESHVSATHVSEEEQPDIRLSFGSVAERYDRARPGYPESLIDILWENAQLEAGDRALEIGAGTGQATISFAARGLNVLAVEPSAAMAAIIDRKLSAAGHEGRTVVSDFESVELEDAAFNLIYAATSWHWLDPERRFAIAGRAIAPGGTLAVLWTWPRWRANHLIAELDAAYERSGAPLETMGPIHPTEPDAGALGREWSGEIERSDVFEKPLGKLIDWSQTYTATEYTDLLGTYGDHIGLRPEVRAQLFADIESIIDADEGAVELHYRTLLLTARAERPS